MLKKVGILTAILLLAAGAVACSSSDNDPTKTPTVRSRNGLSVAFAIPRPATAQDKVRTC